MSILKVVAGIAAVAGVVIGGISLFKYKTRRS